jgi:hypothetical protein
MAIADMIPTLDDTALANLRDNAARLGVSGAAQQQKQAAILLPLIEAELASRKAAKPKPVRGVAKKKVVVVDSDA